MWMFTLVCFYLFILLYFMLLRLGTVKDCILISLLQGQKMIFYSIMQQWSHSWYTVCIFHCHSFQQIAPKHTGNTGNIHKHGHRLWISSIFVLRCSSTFARNVFSYCVWQFKWWAQGQKEGWKKKTILTLTLTAWGKSFQEAEFTLI